jgi:ABC-type transporter Mla MlaB component
MAGQGTPTPQFVVRGPIERADLEGLTDRVCRLLARSRGPVVHCRLSRVAPDAVTVDALARLQLAARRYGRRVLLRGASDDLRDLVSFMGLADVFAE